MTWTNRPFIRVRKGRQKTEQEAEREGKGKKIQSRVVGRHDDDSRRMAEKVAGRTKLRSSLPNLPSVWIQVPELVHVRHHIKDIPYFISHLAHCNGFLTGFLLRLSSTQQPSDPIQM